MMLTSINIIQEKMKYKVYPFLLCTLMDDKVIIQNAYNIVVLKNKKMIMFFEKIERDALGEICDIDIHNLFPNSEKEAIQFMINNKLIYCFIDNVIEFESINIYTNNKVIYNSLLSNLSDFNKYKIFITYNDDLENVDDKLFENCLNIFVLNPFNYRKIGVITKKVKNNLIQMIFYYNNKFYFSNYYKRVFSNPCPECFFSKIESELRAESQVGTNNFQTVIDLIYNYKPMFETNLELTKFNCIPVIFLLLQQLNNINEDKLKLVEEIDINSFSIIADFALHWELCSCNDK